MPATLRLTMGDRAFTVAGPNFLTQASSLDVFKRLLKTHLFSQFLARDSMLSALYAIARPSVCLFVCLSVCLSVRLTGGSVENG